MAVRGFVLTPTYRIVDGRPAVHLYGVLEDGEPVLVVDDRLAPYFFVRAVDAGHVAGPRVVPTDLRTFAGEPVVRVEVALPRDVPPLRARLAAAGVPTYEADLRFAYRWLIDRGILGAFAVEGPFERRPGIGRVYRNPALAPAAFTPRLRVLSLDVETSLDATTVYSIAVAGAGGERVFLVGDAPVAGAEVVPDERTLIARFLAHVRPPTPTCSRAGTSATSTWRCCCAARAGRACGSPSGAQTTSSSCCATPGSRARRGPSCRAASCSTGSRCSARRSTGSTTTRSRPPRGRSSGAASSSHPTPRRGHRGR